MDLSYIHHNQNEKPLVVASKIQRRVSKTLIRITVAKMGRTSYTFLQELVLYLISNLLDVLFFFSKTALYDMQRGIEYYTVKVITYLPRDGNSIYNRAPHDHI